MGRALKPARTLAGFAPRRVFAAQVGVKATAAWHDGRAGLFFFTLFASFDFG